MAENVFGSNIWFKMELELLLIPCLSVNRGTITAGQRCAFDAFTSANCSCQVFTQSLKKRFMRPVSTIHVVWPGSDISTCLVRGYISSLTSFYKYNLPCLYFNLYLSHMNH